MQMVEARVGVAALLLDFRTSNVFKAPVTHARSAKFGAIVDR
jgi:hypothetical protein